MFTFTALSGAQSTSRASQSILELDGGVKVLVDVGWDERFDTRQLAELEKHVSTLSFILLTHATISHLGAYAHCCKHIPLFSQIPVYATPPVIAFGRTALQDLYSSAPAAATFLPASASPEDQTSIDDTTRSNILREAPTFDEINAYFGVITPLKYSQPHQPTASYFSAPLEGLTLTAYNAGHTLGGTIWHIQHGMESIVYAVDWHQGRENVIAGAAWFDGIGGSEVSEALRKPTALVCSSVNGDKVAIAGGRKARDDALLGHIRSCLSKGGSVLIPIDSSARVLELAWLLEKTWQEGTNDETLRNARVYMASKSAHATLRHARSLLEWMDDSIVREFEGNDDDNAVKSHKRSGSKQVNGASKTSRPFEFRHVRVVESQVRLDKVLKGEGPRVIIASDLSAEWGYSRVALEHIAQKPDNLIILTDRVNSADGLENASASTLWKWHQERPHGVALDKSLAGDQIEQVHTGGQELLFRDARRASLDEAELAKYQQYMATQRQMKDSLLTSDGRQLADAEDALDVDDESSSESEDEEDEQQGRALNVSAALTHGNKSKVALSDEDLGVSILLRKKDVFDYDVRNKRGRNAVFPYTHSRRRGDEFGDFIKPEDFLREEEKEAQEAMLDDKNTSVLGQKRKWSEDKNRHLKSNKKQKAMDYQPASGGAVDGDGLADASDSESDTEEVNLAPQGPSKIVYEEKRISFHARLAFVDFAGLHDQRSLQMLIPLINPKKLILIGGTQSQTVTLANDCKELLGMKVIGHENESKAEIYSPRIGEVIDASVDTNAWIVKLTRELAKRLQWQNVKNMSIVTVTGQLRAEGVQVEEENTAKKAKLTDETKESVVEDVVMNEYQPVLDALPLNVAASTRTATQPIHVGDLRLADLRRLMRDGGHSAVFRGEGTLLIDDMVAVRKLASGRITVEGSPISSTQRPDAESFRHVKRKIYEGLAVVAAG
ncbi:hypothetical protein H2198_000817 [Neophaeococcomyces mojaviensis]|uniref:Uncharacterized protein n=1 Tax=Neophaeococcomyces mojaviensis TaxID=3383035 RepID=A0ACC3AIV8_9EURO|nr:hypothetical protein H2198_000817 [Knufia sp. JES_112]